MHSFPGVRIRDREIVWSFDYSTASLELGHLHHNIHRGGKAIPPMMVAPYPTFICGLTLVPSLLILLIVVILFFYWLYRMRRKRNEEE